MTVAPPETGDEIRTITVALAETVDETRTITVAPPETGSETRTITVVPPESDDETRTITVVPPESGDETRTITVVPPESGDETRAITVVPLESGDETRTITVVPPESCDETRTVTVVPTENKKAEKSDSDGEIPDVPPNSSSGKDVDVKTETLDASCEKDNDVKPSVGGVSAAASGITKPQKQLRQKRQSHDSDHNVASCQPGTTSDIEEGEIQVRFRDNCRHHFLCNTSNKRNFAVDSAQCSTGMLIHVHVSTCKVKKVAIFQSSSESENEREVMQAEERVVKYLSLKEKQKLKRQQKYAIFHPATPPRPQSGDQTTPPPATQSSDQATPPPAQSGKKVNYSWNPCDTHRTYISR